MDKRFLFPSVVLLAIFSNVQSQFTNGATANECVSLEPAGVTPATGTAPFIIAVLGQPYTPGGTPLQVFIATGGDVSARGLVIQARRATGGDNTPVGTFALPEDNLYRLQTCGSSTGGTITNINDDTKLLPLQFSWTPPSVNVGSVAFIVSLVDVNGDFWSNVGLSSPVQSSLGEPVSILSIETCPVPTIQNNAGTWNSPNCLRGTQTLANAATCVPPSGSTFPGGDSTITCTCMDGGETASCTTVITITETDNPCDPNPCENGGTCIPVTALQSGFFCQCPQGFPQPTCTGNTPPNPPNCPSPGVTATAPAGSTGVQVDYGAVQCTDVQDGIITATCDFPSGSFFNLGTTPVVCTCLDSGALTSGCPFNVIVTSGTGVCANNPCSGNECRESATSLAGYTCHSVTGTPCDLA